jgi:hypothetical protein
LIDWIDMMTIDDLWVFQKISRKVHRFP